MCDLPATLAAAAIATTVAAIAPTATTTAAAPATTTTAKAAAPTTTAALRGSRFIDNNIPAHEIVAVQSLNGAVRFLIVIDFNESEAAWLSRKAVADQRNIRRRHPGFAEQRS
jgi:hypothetical protein